MLRDFFFGTTHKADAVAYWKAANRRRAVFFYYFGGQARDHLLSPQLAEGPEKCNLGCPAGSAASGRN
jgi:hypothetical protein